MQRNQRVNKKKIYVDSVHFPELVKVAEISLEQGTVEVSEYRKKTDVKDGITKFPKYRVTFNEKNGSNRYKTFKDWFDKNETHEVVLEETDAHGAVYRKNLHSGVECSGIQGSQEYDAGGPAPAQFWADLLPYHIKEIKL